MKKNNYDGFGGWIKYLKDYKSNKENLEIIENESVEADRKTRKLGKKLNTAVINNKLLEQEKDNLMVLLNKRIEVLSNELTNTKKRNNELRNVISSLYKETEQLKIKAERSEMLRRKKAGTIGGLKATVTKCEKKREKLETENIELRQKLNKAEHTINYYKKNMKKPDLEQLKAYEFSRKAVEQRLKDKDEIIQ